MDERKLIDGLAAAAGLSAMELQGFYDTIKEKGRADPEDMAWLLQQNLPVPLTFNVMELPDPYGATVPFGIIKLVFEKMFNSGQPHNIDNIASDPGQYRFFMVSYVVTKDTKVLFGEGGARMPHGMYPNKNLLINQLAKDENVHHSSVGILNIREMNEKDFNDYLGPLFK